MNNYLVPANSKRSALYFGLFTGTDLIILGIGIGISVMLLLIVKNANLAMLLLSIFPGLFCAFLVFPIANYHNVLQFIINIYSFYFGRRKYYWKGWCVKDYVNEDDNRKF